MTVAVYPTCAGIDLSKTFISPKHFQFTPHLEGSTLCYNNCNGHSVFTRIAGIEPYTYAYSFGVERFTLLRGDQTVPALFVTKLLRFTPHARGSTFYPVTGFVVSKVLPRMRGDRPLEKRE